MIRSLRNFLPGSHAALSSGDRSPTPQSIIVLGHEGVGKSTLINALLGEAVIPLSDEDYDLSTDVLTQIKYGDSPEALVYFHHPLPPNPRAATPAPAAEHLSAAGQEPPPPLSVPVRRVWDYVMAPQCWDHRKKLTPIQKVELSLPNPRLVSGLTLADTRGYDPYSGMLERYTRHVTEQADLILVVLDASTLSWDRWCQRKGDTSSILIDAELSFLWSQLPEHPNICFILNRRGQMNFFQMQGLRTYLAEKTALLFPCGAERVFCIDAQQALTSALEHDPKGRRLSGVTALERILGITKEI